MKLSDVVEAYISALASTNGPLPGDASPGPEPVTRGSCPHCVNGLTQMRDGGTRHCTGEHE